MKRSACVLALTSLAASALVAGARDARACGGCFHPPSQTISNITDERMLLAVSQQQTTLYDQISYSGSPANFAWVLPIHGTVSVGLSADVLFDTIDELTATTVSAPPVSCAVPASCLTRGGAGAGLGATAGSAANDAVTVTKAQNVGPYATVQLHSTDASALNTWLVQNGYAIPQDVQQVITAYVGEGFDFLAMKLLPNQGVQAMRPVRVTSPGISLSLPMRMASVGTGALVGITIWVVSDGRYEPQNYPFFHIADSEIVWDFGKQLSNYTTLESQHEALLQNGGWEIQSSITLNEQLITSVILAGGQYYGNVGGGFGGAVSQVADPSADYLPVGDADAGADAGAQTADEVRATDIQTLFAGLQGPTVRVTRMRGDIAHAAMTKDLVLTAPTDQSELSNLRTASSYVNLQCPVYNGCAVVGQTVNGGGPIAPGSSVVVGASGSSGPAGTGASASGGTRTLVGGGGCAAAPTGDGARDGALALVGVAAVVAAGRKVRSARRRRR